jgi:hypothetical protein
MDPLGVDDLKAYLIQNLEAIQKYRNGEADKVAATGILPNASARIAT